MTIVRLKAVVLAAAIAAAAAMPHGNAARAAAGDPLSALSGPLAEAGYSLTWKSMTLDPSKGRVQAKGVSSADATGRVVARIGSIALDRPRAAPGGGWTAEQLVLDSVDLPGPARTQIQRVVVARPDLRAVARLLAAFRGSPATAGGPLDIEHLELHGVSQDWAAPGGERIATTLDRLRVTDLRLDPAAVAVGGDPDRLRPLAVLAGVQVGLLEATGMRSRSSLSGTTEIARQWIRGSAQVPGRSGMLQYGSEGVRMQADGGGDVITPFLTTLFPPDGEVRSRWSGEVSYDIANRFVGYRQRTTVDGFGVLDAKADLRGLPDLTLGEWKTVREDDPRLATTMVDGFSASLTDAGGVERVIATMSEENGTPPAERRAAFADEFGAIGEGFNPGRDPTLAAWLRALQEFVRAGGTLALAAARPVPLGAVAGQDLETGELPELANRYGLSLQRR